jgi:hypothetical protein
MEMGILRLGEVYPGQSRTTEINPYTQKPDLGLDGQVEYYGNIGEHCIAVAFCADVLGRNVLGQDNSTRDKITSRALVHDASKAYEIMRKKAVREGAIVEAYSPKAYDTIKPLLEEKQVARDIIEYMANAGSETGHNSMSGFVAISPEGEPVLDTNRSLADMIVHLADDMTFTPIVNAGEKAPTSYLTVEERMEASDFPNRYAFLYQEGFGFDKEGKPVNVNDVTQADPELNHVRTYADWQVWVADSIATHLAAEIGEQQGTPINIPPEDSGKYLKRLVNSALE